MELSQPAQRAQSDRRHGDRRKNPANHEWPFFERRRGDNRCRDRRPLNPALNVWAKPKPVSLVDTLQQVALPAHPEK